MAVVHQYLPTTDPGAVGAATFLMEISAGNGGKISTKDFQKARQALPYSRPSYLMTAGGKVCSQCGTNRTPQWREGPEGPKTLCNACGVKRVRQMRVLTEGGQKRRPPLPAFAPKTAASLAKQSSGSFSSDNNAAVRRRERSPSVRRPQRKAAAKAASRTAEFATTGDWPDDDGDATYSNPSAGQYTYTEPSNSDDSAALNSDSAEEVAWTPMRGPGPAHTSMPQPPSPFPAVGHETAAAVNLLSMSITQQDLAATRANGGIGGPSSGSQHMHAQDLQNQALQKSMSSVNFNSASLAAMAYAMMNGEAAMEEHTSTEQAVEALQDALRSLPSKEHVQMLLLKEELENSAREAAAADAAVAAVAKILAIKQAAAIRARASATGAAKKMHHWMTILDEQYGWSRAVKKQRL